MAGFRKAKCEQAALKMSMFGPQGSGKTFTALLIAEAIAAKTKKRIAYVDTEHGADFYATEVKERKVHPEAFDFDAMYTRSLTEILEGVKGLDFKEHSVIVVDSMTHVWEAAMNAFDGKLTSQGGIPIAGWKKVKRPYKELMNYLINSLFHIILCGRQGVDFEEVDGESKVVGYKMKAEGETQYEPNITIHMQPIKQKNKQPIIAAFVEKDRTGIMSGKYITNPNFQNLAKPWYDILGDSQAHIEEPEVSASKDAEKLQAQEQERDKISKETLKEFSAKFDLCKNEDGLKKVNKEITKEVKAKMITEDVSSLREKYTQARDNMKGEK